MDVKQLLVNEDRTTIERWVESRANGTYLGSGMALARVLGKYLMCIPARELSVTPRLILDGYWEMWVTMAVARAVKPGWRCVDVGANLGYFTLLFADLVGDEGHVEAFELQRDLAKYIKRSARMSGLYNRITVHSTALGDSGESGKRAFADHLDDPDDCGSVAMQIDENPTLLGGVPCSRLDELLKPEEVDFVKIDTEGHEPQIWAGMSGILQAGRPMQVLLEFTPRLYESPDGFLDQIQRDGFQIRRVDYDGELADTSASELLAAREMEMIWASR